MEFSEIGEKLGGLTAAAEPCQGHIQRRGLGI